MTDPSSQQMPVGARAALDRAAAAADAGDHLLAIDLLEQARALGSVAELECRLVALRHEAFPQLEAASAFAAWPVHAATNRPHAPSVPELAVGDRTAAAVREAVAAHGCALLPGLLGDAEVQELVTGVDHVLELRAANQAHPFRHHGSWLASLQLPPEQAHTLGRDWVAGSGGILACDSPKLLELVLATYERVGLRRLLRDYLGERPVLSANKCTLRRVSPTAKADWHQDGAFLGSGIRALNVWVALTDCGEDAPGMDLVPRRFEQVQETGTGGSYFDWAVGPDTVATLARDAPVIRPHFRAGDALLFDDLFLHRTAVEPEMVNPRYAIESWFFAKTDYPEGQVPLVW